MLGKSFRCTPVFTAKVRHPFFFCSYNLSLDQYGYVPVARERRRLSEYSLVAVPAIGFLHTLILSQHQYWRALSSRGGENTTTLGKTPRKLCPTHLSSGVCIGETRQPCYDQREKLRQERCKWRPSLYQGCFTWGLSQRSVVRMDSSKGLAWTVSVCWGNFCTGPLCLKVH